jgi:dienelactone hydrolase
MAPRYGPGAAMAHARCASVILLRIALCGVSLLTAPAFADPIPLEVFAAAEGVTDVAISPSGRYLAEIALVDKQRTVLILDRQSQPKRVIPVLSASGSESDFSWCAWAGDKRLLCSSYGVQSTNGVPLVWTRLVAVDPSTRKVMPLLQNSDTGGGQFEDHVIDWQAGEPDTVLVEADENLLDAQARQSKSGGNTVYGRTASGAYPGVFAVNVVTGQSHLVMKSHEPIMRILSDSLGHPRLGYGVAPGSKTVQYFVRPSEGGNWQHLLQFEAFAGANVARPVAIDAAESGRAFAVGPSLGRSALWTVDLADKDQPRLLFGDDQASVTNTLSTKDGRFYGVLYDSDRPHTYYTDQILKSSMHAVDAALSDTLNVVVDASGDRSLLVIRSTSDVEPGTYYLFNASTLHLESIDKVNSTLKASQLVRAQTVRYSARDGTPVQAYLLKALDTGSEALPLVVLPLSASPRDWHYSFLEQFLVNRGYAVLQTNGRDWPENGSDIVGSKGDWGGQVYNDIVDGARWAVQSGLADPHRIAIVGSGLGGYEALLGAVRNGDVFRCAVSIDGFSDLSLLLREFEHSSNRGVVNAWVGADSGKLHADSPRGHAAEIRIPVLLVHGEKDPYASVEQSQAMSLALKSAKRDYEFVEVKGADHKFTHAEDRIALLEAVEKFLRMNMAAMAP